MAFKVINYPGAQPIDETSTTQKHPLGTLVKASDPDKGEGEFIYAKGVASTAVADFVVFSSTTYGTTRAVSGSRGPGGVAMSANVANQFGWYQVRGIATVNSAANNVANPQFVTATDGVVDDALVLAQGIGGMQGLSSVASGTIQASLLYPFVGIYAAS